MVIHQSLSATPTLTADGKVVVPLDHQQTQRHLAFHHHHHHLGPSSPSSAMAPSSAAATAPLGVILLSKDESAERVLFMYPFERHQSAQSAAAKENYCEHKDFAVTGKSVPKLAGGGCGTADDARDQTTTTDSSGDRQTDGMALDGTSIGFPIKMLAPLLVAKGSNGNGAPFEIKVDNLRFAGFPWHISGCVHSLAVVFILRGSADRHIVDAFQRLSKKIAIAINTEQQRCNYLRDQLSLMQPSHDEYEALPDELKKGRCPYKAILEKSGLAKHLRDIFEDVCEYGMVDVFVDDCIEVGFCVEPKALCHVVLASRSAAEIEATMRHIRPYHGLLFLDESIPNPDSNPFVRRFIDEYEPSRSFEELAKLSCLPIGQVLQIVRHYLLWARAMLIYPICTSNVYANAPQQPHNFRTLEAQFADRFGSECCSMADVLEAFSPPCSLGSFLQDMTIYAGRPSLHMSLMVFLLRNQLLVQLHTFFFLLPLSSADSDANDGGKNDQHQLQHNQRPRGRRRGTKDGGIGTANDAEEDAKIEEEEEGEEEDDGGTEAEAEWQKQQQHQWVGGTPPPPATELALSPELCSLVHDSCEFIAVALKSQILAICSRAIHFVGVPQSEVFDTLAAFMQIVPFLDGRHHLEDIMYRTQLERSSVMRILDTFSDIVCPFYCHDVVLDTE